jgi:cytochrome c biogenesis protein CcmG/thiol:disulfide interchange protein DsbE
MPRESAFPKRLLVLLPLAGFLALTGLFAVRLGGGDPSRIPSALVGRPAPALSLPPVPGLVRNGKSLPGIEPAAFQGRVSLVNVWASWCVPCHDEVPFLERLGQDARIRLVGLNYKDRPDDARRFLGRYGNPYAAAGADESGRAGIEWGVYGVPETFVVGRDGRIVFKLIGPITPDSLAKLLMPEIERALATNSGIANRNSN